jgi:uncharacterized membrane protein YjjP (DUF1212 family)
MTREKDSKEIGEDKREKIEEDPNTFTIMILLVSHVFCSSFTLCLFKKHYRTESSGLKV